MSLFTKRYDLPMTRDYVAHWGFTEAVRELLQNAIDSESPFRCTYIDGTLRIISESSSLPTRTLLLGCTSKSQDETKIGSFGEGYKIALLVLTRLDKQVAVYNDDVIWRPEFRVNGAFGVEALSIAETKRDKPYDDMLIFEIHGVSKDEYESIVQICLHLQDVEDLGEVRETKYGRIMMNRSGKLYVNGLLVCDTDMDYSYDVMPQHIKLERDRQTVRTWDLQIIAKDMWFDTERYDEVAEMIERNCPDMYNADLGTPDMVKDATYRLFMKRNPGAIAVKTQEELDKYVANGMTNVIVVNHTMHTTLNSYAPYKATSHVLSVQTPLEVLEIWMRENRNYMRKEAIVNFKELIKKSLGWKAK